MSDSKATTQVALEINNFPDARKEATEKAIAAGAKPETIELLDQEDVPLAYLPGNATRIRLKVVGELNG